MSRGLNCQAPARGATLTIRAAPMRGWLTIDRLTLVDDRGHSMPRRSGRCCSRTPTVGGRRRSTVRHEASDRLRTKMGRAKKATSSTRTFAPAARRSFPNGCLARATGHRDDPLLAISGWTGRSIRCGSPSSIPAAGRSRSRLVRRAHLMSVEDTRMTVDISTANGGYVVLSEAHCQGWRARIDGARAAAPLQRVDVMFQGARLPPGRHTVVFELASTTLRAASRSACLR